jgi:tRNA U34 5-methylaminomethyl-2-thiouridine-forming methyltransferase MnmC
MKRHLQLTADGSHTIQIDELNVTYHSKHGAIQESRHVFIDAGISYLHQVKQLNEYRILEMGFGTGLNALLTAIFADQMNVHINYHSVEAFPLTADEVAMLNYGTLLQQVSFFSQMHAAPWNTATPIHPKFELNKHYCELSSFITQEPFHIIYYDAFAPTAQPELWTVEVFEKLYRLLKPEGLLVTYCSKGVVRRAMEAAGFRVTKLQGPPGKREMVRASRDH